MPSTHVHVHLKAIYCNNYVNSLRNKRCWNPPICPLPSTPGTPAPTRQKGTTDLELQPRKTWALSIACANWAAYKSSQLSLVQRLVRRRRNALACAVPRTMPSSPETIKARILAALVGLDRTVDIGYTR
eukprot:1182197-Prorocentrum_minimum.AAC.2